MLILLCGMSVLFLIFSPQVRAGAYSSLMLSLNTIIPSLMPILIIFLIIIKTGARDVIARMFGFLAVYIFNLPMAAMPVIIMGQLGGYPTGAILTSELLDSGDIDEKQAQALLSFNMCGGAGFIITAVGAVALGSTRAGVILLASSIIANMIIGFCLSFTRPRIKLERYSFSADMGVAQALIDACDSAVKAMLNITAYVVLFGGVMGIMKLPSHLIPLFEITQGLCKNNSFTLCEYSAYLAFGGLCVILQLVPIAIKCRLKILHFVAARGISALISYVITRVLVLIFPTDIMVFASSSECTPVMSSVNMGLSILLVAGSFILILDINSKKRILDK